MLDFLTRKAKGAVPPALPEGTVRILMLHFPPFNEKRQDSGFTQLAEEYGINYMLPEPEEQKLVMSMIYDGIKADNEQYFDTEPIKAALRAMQQRGADAFVLGCTELPIVFSQCALAYSVADPTQILAEAAVAFAGYPVKKLY